MPLFQWCLTPTQKCRGELNWTIWGHLRPPRCPHSITPRSDSPFVRGWPHQHRFSPLMVSTSLMLTTARSTRKFRIFRSAASRVRQLSPHHTSSHPIHSLWCGAHRLPPIEGRSCHMPPHSPSKDAARYFTDTCINRACVVAMPICVPQCIRTAGLGYTSGSTRPLTTSGCESSSLPSH